jgi:DNA-binding NarL/FixJ family response regulator
LSEHFDYLNRQSLEIISEEIMICFDKGVLIMQDIKIIIADDHTVVRKGTRQILEEEKEFEVVGEAANGEEAVKLAAELKPNIVIMDISMPVIDGIEATRRIKVSNPDTAVLILSVYDNDEFVFALLEAGAAGYLLKDASGQDIIRAIRAILRGESVLHPVIARKVMNRFFPVVVEKKGTAKVLGEREMEVLLLASKALSNQEIADKLGLSLHTIEAHMRHIFSKLQVSSRTEAVLFALKKGWIVIED